ncbi:MAG: AmmeMemoRadiSam system protein B [gamma proteobacterium symbiont of Taylorina sp.]|nr:AmmeMemoRadiSam system protein B [gamma proteobacterium symbiont of Taylorina sp.]
MNRQAHIRPPAVAGSFYSANADELDSLVQGYLDNSKSQLNHTKPLAMIVPHAGLIYSGSIAASGYSRLQPYAQQITQVVLIGPSHHVPLLGIATSSYDYFQTPLGDIPLDREAIQKLNQFTFVNENDSAHAQEHSLEVQLPFLQKILPEFKLLPLVVSQAEDQQISDIIETLWSSSTLFLLSSDLSHFLNYEQAQQCDQATCRAIEALNPQVINYEQACGRAAIAGILLSAKKHGLQVETLDLRNSGDTAGDKNRVVGYGCWAFFK